MHKTFYKIPLLAFAMLLSAFSLQAQDDDNWFGDEDTEEAKGKISGGVLHVPFGITSFSKDQLNASLDGQEFGTIAQNDYSLGFDGTFFVRNFVVRIGTNNTFKQDVSSRLVSFKYDQRQTEIGLGYNVFSKKGFILYPSAQFGQFRTTVVSAFSGPPNVPVQGVFSGGYVGTEATQKGYYIGAGIGLDYMLGFNETSGSGLAFGLQAGYNYQLSAGNWQAYGLDLGGNLNDDMSGPYVRLSIGFAGWHRQ